MLKQGLAVHHAGVLTLLRHVIIVVLSVVLKCKAHACHGGYSRF